MKNILLILVIAFKANQSFAQIFMASKTEISFYSATPVEDIKAKNINATSILNTTNNEIVFKVPNTGFKFDNSLMEDHFNENYMETPKFPTSEFKGKINESIDYKQEGSHDVTVTGKMKIHGKEVDKTYKGKIIIKGTDISVDAKFEVALKEHDIKVPKLVVKNIAENIETTIHAEYKPYEKKK
jgi:polyisoprenoid-binding protein YceI